MIINFKIYENNQDRYKLIKNILIKKRRKKKKELLTFFSRTWLVLIAVYPFLYMTEREYEDLHDTCTSPLNLTFTIPKATFFNFTPLDTGNFQIKLFHDRQMSRALTYQRESKNIILIFDT